MLLLAFTGSPIPEAPRAEIFSGGLMLHPLQLRKGVCVSAQSRDLYACAVSNLSPVSFIVWPWERLTATARRPPRAETFRRGPVLGAVIGMYRSRAGVDHALRNIRQLTERLVSTRLGQFQPCPMPHITGSPRDSFSRRRRRPNRSSYGDSGKINSPITMRIKASPRQKRSPASLEAWKHGPFRRGMRGNAVPVVKMCQNAL